MSSTRHAVMRGPSFTGFGKRPSLMPAHHVDLLTGIGPFGERIEASRTKPVVGSSVRFDKIRLRLFVTDIDFLHPATPRSLKVQKLDWRVFGQAQISVYL